MIVWVSGLFMMSLLLTGLRHSQAPYMPRERRFIIQLKRWNHRVTSVAMVMTWALGITLAMTGKWFPAPWLSVKITLVLGLSALHGVQTGLLRRLTGIEPLPMPALVRLSAGLSLAIIATIVCLVMLKPSFSM
ncbi:CopD family protein [Pseudomonas sp.]